MNNNFTKHLQWLLRHFITIFSCVLITVLGIAAFTQATTIGTDISTTNLTVTGNASTTGTFNLTGLATFLNGMTITGNATTTGNMNIGGTLDVTATSTFSGRVGVGTTTPSANLYIYQDSPTANQKLFQVGTSNDSNRFSIDEDGDVSMDAAITTTGNITVGGVYFSSSGASIIRQNGAWAGSALGIIGGANAASYLTFKSTTAAGTSDYINFNVGNNGAIKAMRIVSSGNVGIGTTTPQYDLHISDATNASSTIAVGDAAVTGCLVMGNSGGGVSYITVSGSTLTATTTKPSICQ